MAGALEAGVGAPTGQATEPAGILGQDPVLQEEAGSTSPQEPLLDPFIASILSPGRDLCHACPTSQPNSGSSLKD